jgi:putative methylase
VTDSRAGLERALESLTGFAEPVASLEQYQTPADIAAHIVHLAWVNGDIEGRQVVDLGCGTGMLGLGAALRAPAWVLGIDIDPEVLVTARRNAAHLAVESRLAWCHGDVASLPIDGLEETTVLMNPPFGAQRGHTHADRPFLAAASSLGTVSYSVHNAGSRAFVESYAADTGGTVTEGHEATLDLPHQFEFHEERRRQITAEVFRIEWR